MFSRAHLSGWRLAWALSQREWLDFIGYWPGMPPFVQWLYRDKKVIEVLAEGVKRFYDQMAQRE